MSTEKKLLKELKDLFKKKNSEIRNLENEVSDQQDEISDLEFHQPEPINLYKHMRRQPLSCRCSICRMDLEINATIDNDEDLKITVKPCRCQTKDPS